MRKGNYVTDKIQVVTKGLTATYSKSLRQLSTKNANAVCDYISAMRAETNLSDNYRCAVILTLGLFSRFSKDIPFKSMARSHVILFLQSILKPEDVDPLHKSIGTYNYYNVILTRFFKWLYHPNMPAKTRPKPAIVENIAQLKRREISIYNPEDLWTEEDDLLFLKYCQSKRTKCYHTVSRDFSARPHEILKLKIKNIQFKTSGTYQYAEATLPSGKTGTRHVPIINSIPFVKDYLDHEHPQPNNLEAPFICGTGRSLGKHIRPVSLTNIYTLLKKEYFPSLVLNPNVPTEDKDKIKELLK
jgi:integrase/recombinase XerD